MNARCLPPERLQPAGWPWAGSREFAAGLRRLLAAVQGLPLAGWEASCRLSPGRCEANRLLLGLELAGVAPARLAGLPQALAMPAALAEGFAAELGAARRVLLALEQGARALEFKTYLEFGPQPPEPLLAMRGRKWLQADASQQRTTDYLRPALSLPELRRALSRGVPELAPAHALLDHALGLALARGHTVDWLSVAEPPGLRASGCLRLYGSGLCLHHLHPLLSRLARDWHIPAAPLAQLPGARALGWLAAGLDGSGTPFLTLYGQASLADARQALALGAFDAQP